MDTTIPAVADIPKSRVCRFAGFVLSAFSGIVVMFITDPKREQMRLTAITAENTNGTVSHGDTPHIDAETAYSTLHRIADMNPLGTITSDVQDDTGVEFADLMGMFASDAWGRVP